MEFLVVMRMENTYKNEVLIGDGMSNKFDINNFVIDKVLTVCFGYVKCYKCGFDNSESLYKCPVCGTELIGKRTELTDEEV